MKVFIWSDTTWSVGRVYRDAMKALEYEYRFVDWKGCPHTTFLSNYEWCDRAITNLAGLNFIKENYSYIDLRKFLLLSHGFPEHANVKNYDTTLHYGMTSDCLANLFPDGIHPYLMPNGVDPENFNYVQRDGSIRTLGWCGAPRIVSKQIGWANEISNQTKIPLQIASNLSYAEIRNWYNTIDVLLVTSVPIRSKETGPLPAFEAIVSGVPVLGTPVGNFYNVPGPKFTTVEEAVSQLEYFKQHPDELVSLAKEQYNWVMQNWTYKTLAKYWKHALEFS